MKARGEISSRSEFKRDYKVTLFFITFWLSVSFLILLLLPERAWDIKFHGLVAIAVIGIWRYSWFTINIINALIYDKYYFPKLKRRANAIDNPYPKRLYFMIPSYKEDFAVSAQVFQALAREVYKIPSDVFVYVSVGSEEEARFIERVVRINDPARRINIKFLKQEMGKRVAMGHTLRAIARHFNDPLSWHPDYKNDIVIFMDGDTVMGKNILLKTLSYFRAYPKLGAVTTDEGINYLGRSKLIYLWYKLKFAKRHLMMMSHSLHRKVLTLTGRWSAFRAHIVLSEEFIRFIEADHLDHYLFGRFRFLMGDDKSTWYYLLKEGWDMLYIPDAIAWSTEDRSGNFFKVSSSLMFRWYGNMLRNNWRAIKLGPRRIGSWFIWWAIVDQRISMWTTLVGPTGSLLLSLFVSPFYLPFYIVWVIWVRILQITILDLVARLNPHVIHLLQHLYDQWVGSIIKIYASSNLAKQRWAKKASQSIEAKVSSFPTLRSVFRQFLVLFYIVLFIFFVGIYVGVFKLPRFGPIPGIANASEQSICLVENFGAKPNDGGDDSVALQKAVDSCDVVILKGGKYMVKSPVVIRRSGVRLKGQKGTIIESRIRGRGEAIIDVEGKPPDRFYTIKEAVKKGEKEIILTEEVGEKGRYIWLWYPNRKEDFAGHRWFREKPYILQGIYEVKDIEENKIRLREPLDVSFPKGTKAGFPRMVENVSIKDIALIQLAGNRKPEEVRFVYENRAPEYAVDGLRVRWGARVRVRNLKVLMAGRHPLNLEHSYAVSVKNLIVDGAWNKGKKGNGYVRFSQTYRSRLSNCEIRNIRHLTFQWSSSGNVVEKCLLEVDVNFHGGNSRYNTVRDSTIRIPQQHPWDPVEKTPLRARWAPPDGRGNRVINSVIEILSE